MRHQGNATELQKVQQRPSSENHPWLNHHIKLSDFFFFLPFFFSMRKNHCRGDHPEAQGMTPVLRLQIQLLVHRLLRAGRSCLVSDSAAVSVFAEERASFSIFFVAAASLPLGIGSLNRSLRFFSFSTVSRCRSSISLFSALFFASASPVLSPSLTATCCALADNSTGLEVSTGKLPDSRVPPLLFLPSSLYFEEDDDDLPRTVKSLSLWLVQRSNFDRPLLESDCSSSEEAYSLCFLEDW